MTEAQILTSIIGMGGIVVTCLVLITSFHFKGQ